MAKATGTKVAASGKVIAAKHDHPVLVRFTGDAFERLNACVRLDAHIHGGEVNVTNVIRKLCHAYCERIEATAASDVARDGAKVLRRKAA